jgi:hypothetical protein
MVRMKSLTIHGLDEQLAALIKQKASEDGLSLNKEIKKLLELSLGLRERESMAHRDEFQQFLGVWTPMEEAEFRATQVDFNKVDTSDWR